MVKTLLAGEVASKEELRFLFSHVGKLCKSKAGPFDLLLCSLAFELDKEEAAEALKAPIPTYYASCYEEGEKEEDVEEKEGDDASFSPLPLGRRGVREVKGLNIAFWWPLSDREQGGGETEAEDIRFFSTLIEAKEDFKGVDLLLTGPWPAGVERLVSQELLPEGFSPERSSATAASLALLLKPRYHCAVSQNLFFQRPPYVNPGGHVTRFVGLCGVEKHPDPAVRKAKKFIHALNLVPLSQVDSEALSSIPGGSTENPFTAGHKVLQEPALESSRKRKHGLSADAVAAMEQEHQQSRNQYFYDSNGRGRGRGRGGRGGERLGRGAGDMRGRAPNSGPPPRPQEVTSEAGVVVRPRADCWFCLATPNVEKHLITSIGEEIYLSQPKGALLPDHQLIVPISHQPSTAALSEGAVQEVERYKAALLSYYFSFNQGMLVFERFISGTSTAHAHLQAIPVPKSEDEMVKVILARGRSTNMKFEELKEGIDLAEAVRDDSYFYFEVFGADKSVGSPPRRLLHRVTGRYRLQFGRDVAAELVEMPQRADWKYCVIPQEAEKKLTAEFKRKFQQFDFTL